MAPSCFFNPESTQFWMFLALFKVFISLNSRVLFCSDESQQEAEVKYQFLHETIDLAWEWDMTSTFKSILNPVIYTVIFKCLDLIHLYCDALVIYAPNIFYAFLSIVSDWCFIHAFYNFENKKNEHTLLKENEDAEEWNKSRIKLSDEHDVNRIVMIAFLIYTITWCSNLLVVKTISNSLETSIFFIILLKFTKIKGDGKIIGLDALTITTLITLSFIVRNSYAFPWLILILYEVFVHKTLKKIVFYGFVCTIPILTILIFSDSSYYEKWTLTFLSFLKFNLTDDKSSNFGNRISSSNPPLDPFIYPTLMYPLMIIGIFQNLLYHWRSKSFPLLTTLFIPYIYDISSMSLKGFISMLPFFLIYCMFVSISLTNLFKIIKKSNKNLLKYLIWCFKIFLFMYIINSLIIWTQLTLYMDPLYTAKDYINSQNPKELISHRSTISNGTNFYSNNKNFRKSYLKKEFMRNEYDEIWEDI